MKILAALSCVVLTALAGCGNDGASSSPAQPTPGSTSAYSPQLPNEKQLARSGPVSTEGAASLNEDCNLEGVDGVLFTTDGATIARYGTHEISGWVVDAKHHTIPQDLRLVVAGVGTLTDVWTNRSPTWIERKGVADSRGYGPELHNSGFSFQIDTSPLPAGVYHVYVISAGAKGLLVCDPGRQVTIAG